MPRKHLLINLTAIPDKPHLSPFRVGQDRSLWFDTVILSLTLTMSGQSQIDPGPKRGRRVTVCIECRKRKKKCDRRWPCNHCRRRQSAHEYKYESKIAIGRNESAADQTWYSFTQEPVSGGVSADTSAAVISLGYMDDPVLKMVTVCAFPSHSWRNH